MVYDGSGSSGMEVDIAIKGDRIVKIGISLDTNKALEVIDATGKAVSPGFIDPHSHTDVHLLINPKAESKIRQGVTTEIGGNCGASYFPLSEKSFEEEKEYLKKAYDLELTWKDINGFFDRLSAQGMALNFATLLGHGALREAVIGPYDCEPNTDELKHMKQLMREHMEAGVVGLSTGLAYAPGSFAETGEIVEICRDVARYSGVYATHIRSHRGFLREGYYADVVVFNPDTVIDRADWTNPHTYPDGIDYVIVNGRIVIKDREHTCELPGRILKKTIT